MAASLCYRTGEIQNLLAIRLNCRDADLHPRFGPESGSAEIGGPPGAIERRGHHHCAALLGLGLGRHGTRSRHSHHRGIARDLRSHRIVEAHRSLAERLTIIPNDAARPRLPNEFLLSGLWSV